MLTDSERFAFETRRHHAFASTGNAYDATQCDEAIKTSNILIVLAEGVVERARDWEVRSSPEDTAVRLAQAMYRSETIEGFEIRTSVLEPVAVGKLEVQQVGEYRGADLKGLILKVRNTGREALPLNENLLAARGSVAFMTPVSELAPGQAAAVYLIQSNGGQ